MTDEQAAQIQRLTIALDEANARLRAVEKHRDLLAGMLHDADSRWIEAETWRNIVACTVDPNAAFVEIPQLIRDLKAKVP